VSTSPDRSAAYFDGWYADMVESPRKDEIEQRHLGLPPQLLSTSLLSWAGIAEVTTLLALAPQDTLLDLACGRGGYGLEIASRTGARLVGVDFSGAAIDQARRSAAKFDAKATFVLGDLAATGLHDESVDAVLCVDAIQFADPPAAAYDEIYRVLKPGGRVALTTWEPGDRDDERVSKRLRVVDAGGGLVRAGFADIVVMDKVEWRVVERAMWEEAAALDPGDDRALRSFHDEGVRAVANWRTLRRVMATARRP
jgi:SAM-dependent methyltransferase